jgi:WS/DGAT/MGAT family acyltransferase
VIAVSPAQPDRWSCHDHPVVDRLSPLDASFLFAEDGATSSMHVGALAIFEPPAGGIDLDELQRYVGDRLVQVPRFRQRVREVPGGLARPVWVDDDSFDLAHHVRRSLLPRPGSDDQLDEFVARVMARPLERDRPLWEIYIVAGLEGGRFALVTKTHHALVDGVAAVDVMQVLLGPSPDVEPAPTPSWEPTPVPSDTELVSHALGELLKAPSQILEGLQRAAGDLGGLVRSAAGITVGLVSTLRAVTPSAGSDAFVSQRPSTRRVFRGVDLSLDEHKLVRAAHGTTVNDVVLCVVTGALRAWLLARGEALTSTTTVRAMVPVSLRGHLAAAGAAQAEEPRVDPRTGNVVSAFFVELPVGESSAAVRLQQVAMDMRGLKDTGQALGAKTVIGMVGYAPTTMHALAARTVNALSDRVFGLAVTNIPGPQYPLYAAGARLVSVVPIAPLAHRQAVAIAVESYDGRISYGLIGDAEAIPDLDVLAASLADALADLVDATPHGRARAQS